MAPVAQRSEVPASDATFDEVLTRVRALAFEFGPTLANHLPMVLWAMHRLGGTVADAERFTNAYLRENGCAPPKPSPAAVTGDTWRDHIGDRAYESAYRAFFADELLRLGEAQMVSTYLPRLLPGVAASALHAFMRLAYAADATAPSETAEALAYWSTCYLPLGTGVGASARTEDPAGVLVLMRDVAAFRTIEPETDLLWHFMRETAQLPEFAPVHDWLAVGPDTLDRLARDSLALFAATMDFCALHALTGTHWLRLVLPLAAGSEETLIRAFWQAIASVYPKIGFAAPLSAGEADAMRARAAPDWIDIARAACASNDEHDLSLVYSAKCEEAVYGDPLYRVVAARRMGLID